MTKNKKNDKNNKVKNTSNITLEKEPNNIELNINTNITNKNYKTNDIKLKEKNKVKQNNSPLLKFIALIFSIIMIIIAIFIGIWHSIPLSQEYISKYLSNKTNLNIKINSIHTSWGNWKPRITIHNIKVYDKKINNKLWFSADNIDLLFGNYTKYGITIPTINFTYINVNNPYILSEQTKNGWVTFNQTPKKEPMESLPNWLFQQELININKAKIDVLSINGIHLPIDISLSLKKHNNINYLSYINISLLGIKADIKALFSPIYKKTEFLGYFKKWQGKNFIELNLDLNKDSIEYYKNFLLSTKLNSDIIPANTTISNIQNIKSDKNIEKVEQAITINNIFNDLKQIKGEIKSSIKWKQTTVQKGILDIEFTKIDGKLPNALQGLMPNLKSHITLNSINNDQQESFIKKYSKDLPNENYVWNINSISWNNENNSSSLNEIKNIVISHPTHNLFPFSIRLQKGEFTPFNDIITRGIIASNYQKLIKYINPKADINNLQVVYSPDNKIHKLLQYAINADIENIQFNYPSINTNNNSKATQLKENLNNNTISMLGKNGFNLKLKGTFENATAKITAKDIIFKLPYPQQNKQNKQNLLLNLVDTDLKWNIDKQINLDIQKLLVQNDEIKLDTKINYTKKINLPADINAQGIFSIKNVNLLNKFLPDNLSEHTKQIIRTMDIDAAVNQAKFSIAGNENQFKNNLEGVKINIISPLQNAKFSVPHVNETIVKSNILSIPSKTIILKEVKGSNNIKQVKDINKSLPNPNNKHSSKTWPRFENIKGLLTINNKQMQIKVDSANAGNLNIGKTSIFLNSFTDNPTLTVNTESNSSLDSMLNYVNNSPVHDWIGSLNFKATGGSSNLKLNLAIPFKDLHSTIADGALNIENSDIEFISSLPVFKQVKSIINFDHKGFKFEQASANFMGENVMASGYSKDHAIYINANGILSKQGIESAGFKSALARIPKYIQGQSPYKASLSIANHKIKVEVDTNLNGIAILLPEPLAKNENESKPLHFSWELINAEKHIEQIKLRYNNLVGAILEQQRENGEAKHIRGIYYADNSFDNDIELPDEGIQAKVNLKYINADAWRNVYNNLQKDLNNKTKIYKEQVNAAEGESELYLPARIAAYTQSLRAMDREIKNIILGISRQDDGWAGNISSSHINGYIKLHPASSKNINGLVEGHFSQLNIPDKQQKQIIADLFQERVQDLPAIDIKIDSFTMLQKSLGRVNINAYNEYTDNKKTWHIKNLSLENNDAILFAKGYWNYSTSKNSTNSNIKSQTNIDVDLNLKNVGNFLNLLGATQVVKKGNGSIKANLEWQGSPLEFNYPSLNSEIKLLLNDGIILKVDPAAAKLLGIISLQGLGNIITFNWNKLFAQGSPFDEIQSNAIIKNGILSTNNFKLNSPQAKVMLSGNIDLMHETQNLQADIYPKINAGSASLAYSLINPAIGLGTLIAQVALSNPLSKILKQSYLVTGKWATPKVKKINNYNDEDDNKYKDLFSK